MKITYILFVSYVLHKLIFKISIILSQYILMLTDANISYRIFAFFKLHRVTFNSQGPVKKFFSSMYEENSDVRGEREEVKAMRLWSDWNAGLRSWASSKVEKVFFSLFFILSFLFCVIVFLIKIYLFFKSSREFYYFGLYVFRIGMRFKCYCALFVTQFIF